MYRENFESNIAACERRQFWLYRENFESNIVHVMAACERRQFWLRLRRSTAVKLSLRLANPLTLQLFFERIS